MKNFSFLLFPGIWFCIDTGSHALGQNALIQKPIHFSAERKQLSLEYLSQRHGIVQQEPVISPCMIVLHHTGGGTLESNFRYFNRTRVEPARADIYRRSKLNVSAHFLVDTDGKIYQLLPETLFARHVIGLNHCAIGIENVGGGKSPLTDKQVEANVFLIRMLCKKFPIKYLIAHAEYGAFRKSSLWKESDASYFSAKGDPDAAFMRKVREKLNRPELRSTP